MHSHCDSFWPTSKRQAQCAGAYISWTRCGLAAWRPAGWVQGRGRTAPPLAWLAVPRRAAINPNRSGPEFACSLVFCRFHGSFGRCDILWHSECQGSARQATTPSTPCRGLFRLVAMAVPCRAVPFRALLFFPLTAPPRGRTPPSTNRRLTPPCAIAIALALLCLLCSPSGMASPPPSFVSLGPPGLELSLSQSGRGAVPLRCCWHSLPLQMHI